MSEARCSGATAPLARIVRIGRPSGDRAEIDLELPAVRRPRLIGTKVVLRVARP